MTRTVRRPGEYILEPDSADLRQAVAEAGEHTELILTRREILKFILAKPGARSQTVQALLKLDSLESARQNLGTAKRQLTRDKKSADERVATTLPDLAGLLGGGTITTTALVDAVNQRRRLLGLAELTEANLSSGPGLDRPRRRSQP